MKKENQMNIRKYLGTSVLSVALLLACGVTSLAGKSQTVTFHNDIVVNGTTLSAGKFVVRWGTDSPEATVEFVQHHKVVVSAQGRVEQRSKPYDRDSVLSNTNSDGTKSLVEIRSAYSNKVLILTQRDLTLKASAGKQ